MVTIRKATDVLMEAGYDDVTPVIVALEGSGEEAMEVVDVQPCLWNAEKKLALSPDDVDLGEGFVPAVAMLVRKR